MKKVLITGNSSGIGLGLSRCFLEAGLNVYGISRRGSPAPHRALFEIRGDLSDLDAIPQYITNLLSNAERLDLAVLNAGILGNFGAMRDTPVEDLQEIMTVNVWSNKVVLDSLSDLGLTIDQVILMSSGAAVKGNYGWSGYALSKAALNMLTQLYAAEMPDTHFTALAPGLVDTAMQDVICDEIDPTRFPSVQKLRDARGTPNMPKPDQAAAKIVGLLSRLKEFPSGTFVDIRDL